MATVGLLTAPVGDLWWSRERSALMSTDAEFDRFFVDHFDRLVRSVTVITNDREIANDCVQEAFIRAYARWRRVRRLDNPVTWVRRVAINQSRDVHRSESRRRRREDAVHAEPRLTADSTTAVEGDLELAGLLQQLSPQQRAVAALFYVEDVSIKEIAASLDLSTGAVKFHLNKAREALRTIVAEEKVHG